MDIKVEAAQVVSHLHGAVSSCFVCSLRAIHSRAARCIVSASTLCDDVAWMLEAGVQLHEADFECVFPRTFEHC